MKTIIEILEEKSLDNSFECNCCLFRIHNSFKEIKYKNLIINKEYPSILTTEEIMNELGDIKKISKEKILIKINDLLDNNRFQNEVIIKNLISKLQYQYKNIGRFEKNILIELGYYTYNSIPNAYKTLNNILKTEDFEDDFLLDLGKTLLLDSFYYEEFVLGLHLLKNLSYQELKENIQELDKILFLAQYSSDLRKDVLSLLYIWNLDSQIFEIFQKEYEQNTFQSVCIIVQTFIPLRENIGLYLASNSYLIKNSMFYSKYIDINNFLINNFSEDILYGALKYGIQNFRSFSSVEEKQKNKHFHEILVKTLLEKDYPTYFQPLIDVYSTILKLNGNMLHEKLI